MRESEKQKRQKDLESAKNAIKVLRRFRYTPQTFIAGVRLDNAPSLVQAVQMELQRLKKAMVSPASLKRIFRRKETM